MESLGPLPPGDTTAGYQRLACAVVYQAIRDLRSRKAEDRAAAARFLRDTTQMGFWCAIGGFNPPTVRDWVNSSPADMPSHGGASVGDPPFLPRRRTSRR